MTTLRNDADMKKMEGLSRKIGIIIAWSIFITLLVAGFLAAGGKLIGTTQENFSIKIRFLQTKDDADCIIISKGKNAIIIDTGEKTDAEMIKNELEEAGITTIDYLILSHPDSDHIGGALEIVSSIPVLKVIEPHFDGEKEELEELNHYCRENGIPIFYPTHIWKVRTDYIHLLIYPALEKHYKDTNNYSLAVLAEHGSVRMFFAGDAKKKRSEELLGMNLPEVELYKVPHHGRANSATDKMFDKLKPEFAVVTSDTADKEVWDACSEWGTELLFTGEGMMTFESDGKVLILEE